MNNPNARVLTIGDLEVIALSCGVIRPDEQICQSLIEFAQTLVFHCAAVAGDAPQGAASDYVMAAFRFSDLAEDA